MLCESRQPETECTLAAQQHAANNLDWLCQLWAGQTWTSKSSQCATMVQQKLFFKKTNSMQDVRSEADKPTSGLMRLCNTEPS